jgi:hypothetical protein
LTAEQKEEINARRRAARQSKALTAKQKEDINARRRAAQQNKKEEINAHRKVARQNKALEERNARQRANRKNLSVEERQKESARRMQSRQNIAPEVNREMNANRRARRQSIPENERQALLAKRKANAAARRNTPCADSIALPCPIVASLATLRLAKEGATSPPVPPSRSTPDYIIGTEGDYSIFTPLLMLRLIKPLLTGYWTTQMTWRASFGASWTRMPSAMTSWTRRMMMKVCSPTFSLALFVMRQMHILL